MSCSIDITSELPVEAGGSIIGSVVCNFSKPSKIKAIQVQFVGNENTEMIGNAREVIYGSNMLVNVEKVIIDEETLVSSGVTKYEFSIEVPKRLPSSFKHWNGEIKYLLKATVKRNLRIDMTAARVIEVITYVDLNTYIPALQIQADYNVDRLVSHCCGLSRGRILLNAVIGKRLFLKGETIQLNLNIVNLSGVRVKKVYSRIMKTLSVFFSNPYPKEEVFRNLVATSRNFPGVKGYGEISYSLDIDIPRDMIIPNLKYSQLFKITYQLQVIAKISGCNTAMVLQFKIYIGHIPFSSALGVEYRSRIGPFIIDSDASSSSSVRKHK